MLNGFEWSLYGYGEKEYNSHIVRARINIVEGTPKIEVVSLTPGDEVLTRSFELTQERVQLFHSLEFTDSQLEHLVIGQSYDSRRACPVTLIAVEVDVEMGCEPWVVTAERDFIPLVDFVGNWKVVQNAA